MVALTRCKVSIPAAGSSPAQDFYFLTTTGLYAGDIATVTGVLAETQDTDYSDEVMVPIKELVRQGVITTKTVLVTGSDGKEYRRTLHVGDAQLAAFANAIEGKSYPVGKGAPANIEGTLNVRRVKSRR